MPNYQYLCPCGKLKERMRSISDRKKEVLCDCGKPMRLQLSMPNIGGMDNIGRSK